MTWQAKAAIRWLLVAMLFIALGALSTLILALLGSWFGWTPVKFWTSGWGLLAFYILSVGFAIVLWGARYLTRIILALVEKRRIEGLPEFVGGDCPERQFHNSIKPRLRRCLWRREHGTGKFKIIVT